MGKGDIELLGAESKGWFSEKVTFTINDSLEAPGDRHQECGLRASWTMKRRLVSRLGV